MEKTKKDANKLENVITTTLIETESMSVSEKLQKSGINVKHITGGTITSHQLTHYFECTLEDASIVLSEQELKLVKVTKEIKKTPFIYSDLEEKIKGIKKEDLLKE